MRSMPLDTMEVADHPQIVTLRDGSVVMAWTRAGERPTVRLVRVREGS